MSGFSFNYSTKAESANVDPEYRVPYGVPTRPIQAKGNISLLQFIDIIAHLWNDANPEIDFVPFKDKHKFDPEKGYIVYSQSRTRPAENFIKPRLHESVDSDDPTKVVQVFTQSFNHVMKFTAVHMVPRTAEEILEDFQDFMIMITPAFIKYGLEDFAYGERPSDESMNRYGEDMAARSVMYIVKTQKILIEETEKIQSIYAQVQVMLANNVVLYEPATPDSSSIHVVPLDNYISATPNS